MNYEIKILLGNHGYWLFILLNSRTIFEQSAFKTEEEAQEFGLNYINRHREIYK